MPPSISTAHPAIPLGIASTIHHHKYMLPFVTQSQGLVSQLPPLKEIEQLFVSAVWALSLIFVADEFKSPTQQ